MEIFDKRIRLDSSGAIVGTPRGEYSATGVVYAANTATAYSIVGANQYGISNYSMTIIPNLSAITMRLL